MRKNDVSTAQPKSGTEWLKLQSRRITEGEELPLSAEEAASSLIEEWLQRHGVAYAPPSPIPMVLIDEKRSRNNQARRDAVVSDSVDRFANALRNGATFPPIVVFPLGGRLIIIDGNNRQAAAKRVGREFVSGIVISEETPSELISLLTVEANAHHGVTPDTQWRVQQAFQLISLGYTDQQAADAVNVNVTSIRVARAIQEAEQRARRMKIHGFVDLPQVPKQALGTLKDDPVFYQAAKVAISTGMTLEQIREMTRMVKAIPSEGARIDAIAALAKERGIEAATKKAMGKVTRRVSSPKTQLVSGIGLLVNVDEAALVRSILTRRDRDLVAERLQQLTDKVLAMQVALEQVSIPDEDEDD